jgi:serine/threonine-protein kinase
VDRAPPVWRRFDLANPEGTWRRASAWFGAPINEELRPAFALERAQGNRRRLLVLLPLMILGHAVHVAVFHLSAAERAALEPRVVQWRDAIVLAHAATLAIAVVLAVGIVRFGRARSAWLFAPLTGAVYLIHGAVVAGIDQLAVTSVTPFVGYCLGLAVVLSLDPIAALIVYAVGLTVFVAAIFTLQPSASARLASLPNGFSMVAVSLTLSALLYSGRRRDFVQRTTIDRQRAALSELNAGLERRVAGQVSEIVARAEEVSQLNAQLQAQVRSRSSELSLALAKLAQRVRPDGGLRKGTVLGDRFEVGDLIGTGGMGAVYAGRDRSTDGKIAIKVIQATSSGQLDSWRRFLREAATTATIAHPAVVRMLHVDVSDDGMLFQVQELVEGATLQSRLRREEPWEAGTVARLASVLCDALASAHDQGVVHRDVKPSNVMITAAAPGLKLLDFGIAKPQDDTPSEGGVTQTGAMLGTPVYMAPEQVEGAHEVSDRADLYAVGVVLFFLLTGRQPFDSPSPRAAVIDRLIHAAPDARSFSPAVPAELADLVARCLAREPSDRPSAGELAQLMARFADRNHVPSVDALERAGALHDARTLAIGAEVTLKESRRALR